MKAYRFLLSWLALFGVTVLAHGQGTFQNLDFESANLAGFSPGASVPITDALPAWTGYINGNPVDRVFYDNIFLSGPSIAVIDSLTPFFPPPIQGSYSAYLHAGASIGQTGQIPDSAASVIFLNNPFSAINVSFGGQNIPMVQLGTSGNNIIMAGNVSSFAGQTGELLFAGGGLFDDIQFSNQAIPEPSTYCLFGLGALLLGWRFLRKR